MNDLTQKTGGDHSTPPNVHEPGPVPGSVPRALNGYRRTLRRLRRSTRIVIQTAVDKSRLAARAADGQAHASPWRFIAITAVIAAAIGYLCGHRRSHVGK